VLFVTLSPFITAQSSVVVMASYFSGMMLKLNLVFQGPVL